MASTAASSSPGQDIDMQYRVYSVCVVRRQFFTI